MNSKPNSNGKFAYLFADRNIALDQYGLVVISQINGNVEMAILYEKESVSLSNNSLPIDSDDPIDDDCFDSPPLDDPLDNDLNSNFDNW